MHDQAKQLQSKGIPAAILGDAGLSLDDLSSHQSQSLVVYVTPEYIFGSGSAQRLQVMKDMAKVGMISLVAIDEAHLLYEWDHFRYSELTRKLTWLKSMYHYLLQT